MRGRAGLLLCVAAALSAACPFLAQDGRSTPREVDGGNRKMVIEGKQAVRWTGKLNADTRQALMTGRRRVAVTVSAYAPPAKGSGTLVVYLLTPDHSGRQEVQRLGIFPNVPFQASPRVEPKRFLVSLARHRKHLEGDEVHLEIAFDASQGPVTGGRAEISIGFVDL